jgi:glutathione peroxidase
MKKSITFFLLSVVIFLTAFCMENNSEPMNGTRKSLHEYVVEDINGESFDLSSLKGKKVMVVNTASKCGLTPQYEELEALYKKYGSEKFTIIAFPSNDFMGQEPGTDQDILTFCKKNYGVTFPIMSKVKVKGRSKCEVYEFLTSQSLNGLEDSDVKWNFQKYLIDEEGFLEKVISPRVSPFDSEIIAWLTK